MNPRFIAYAVLVLLSGRGALAAEDTALRATWSDLDHPSGVYYAKANATCNVIIENLSAEPQRLEGSIALGVVGGGRGRGETR